MKTKLVPIDSVYPDPANVRQHPEPNLAAIRASLARFGQQKPIVIDSKGVIRAGNGTHAAAVALGWDKIGVVVSDLAGVDAVAYAIADNRTSELATWDEVALAETLRSLQSEEDFPLEATGFTAEEVDALIAGLAEEIAEEPSPLEEFPEADETLETLYRCPKCDYRWSGSPK